jgi:hypothetical protein
MYLHSIEEEKRENTLQSWLGFQAPSFLSPSLSLQLKSGFYLLHVTHSFLVIS